MNTTNSNRSLTDYQKAVLTHMGITPWVERAALSSENDSIGAQAATETPTGQNKPAAISHAATQEEKLAGLQRLKQQIVDTPRPKSSHTTNLQQLAPKDAEMAMILCMDRNASQRAIVQDVLNALAYSSDKIIISDQPITTFKNFAFAWQFGDEILFSNKVLTTPEIDQLIDSQQKKILWHHLSHGS